MGEDQLCEEIKRIVTDVLELDVAPGALDSDEPLFDGAGVDSLGALAILAGIERRFGVVVPDDDIGADLFSNVRALARAVWALQLRRSASS